MAGNLRDKGYPQARTEKPRRTGDVKDAVMTNNTPVMPFRGTEFMGSRRVPSQTETAVNRLVDAYNNRAFGISNAPMIQRIGNDYVTDDTDERAYTLALLLRNHGGNRLGFVSEDVTPSKTSYSAGIDNLPFGENYAYKNITTPIGTFGAEYDGDGTASLSYETSPYLAALANLLRR